MSVVIQAHDISKRFFLGEINQDAFFEDVANRFKQGVARLFKPSSVNDGKKGREFWALSDVSFELLQGQTLAIIGNNGAGKSTLLKILSRITNPTKGWVKVRGRLVSLLEIGTGFHPELTGRDNIFLNGAILGMSRQEISQQFDQIVDFSGLEEFIDVPVKRYSSGMYVRLAFSVAAHVNPEIMILDEVLAVGDATFQKKCIDRVEEIIRNGHAAILVSHSMNAVRRMADACMWLQNGRIRMIGNPEDVVRSYESETAHGFENVEKSERGRLIRWWVEGKSAISKNALISGEEDVDICVELELTSILKNGTVSISLIDVQGLLVYSQQEKLEHKNSGALMLRLHLPFLPVRSGVYTVKCNLYEDGHSVCALQGVPELTVEGKPELNYGNQQGILHLPGKIQIEKIA